MSQNENETEHKHASSWWMFQETLYTLHSATQQRRFRRAFFYVKSSGYWTPKNAMIVYEIKNSHGKRCDKTRCQIEVAIFNIIECVFVVPIVVSVDGSDIEIVSISMNLIVFSVEIRLFDRPNQITTLLEIQSEIFAVAFVSFLIECQNGIIDCRSTSIFSENRWSEE